MAEMLVRIEGLVPNPGSSINAVRVGSMTATTTLSAATTGNGTTVDWGFAMNCVSMFIMPNGTVTGGVVDLQVSQDGTNWVKISSSSALATGVNQQLSLSNAAYRYVRGVVSTTVTGGGSVTATVMSS